MQNTDSKQPAGGHEAYGVTERLNGGDPLDEAIAELRVNGYTVIPSALSAEFVRNLGLVLDRVYGQQVGEIGGRACSTRCTTPTSPAACSPTRPSSSKSRRHRR